MHFSCWIPNLLRTWTHRLYLTFNLRGLNSLFSKWQTKHHKALDGSKENSLFRSDITNLHLISAVTYRASFIYDRNTHTLIKGTPPYIMTRLNYLACPIRYRVNNKVNSTLSPWRCKCVYFQLNNFLQFDLNCPPPYQRSMTLRSEGRRLCLPSH